MPLGDHATEVIRSLSACVSVSVLSPVVASQIRAVPRRDAVRMWWPSGDHATAVTGSVCVSVSVLSPVVASQMRVVRSLDVVRMWWPSGDHATAVTQLEWPPRICASGRTRSLSCFVRGAVRTLESSWR